jgi:hypothetical protein
VDCVLSAVDAATASAAMFPFCRAQPRLSRCTNMTMCDKWSSPSSPNARPQPPIQCVTPWSDIALAPPSGRFHWYRALLLVGSSGRFAKQTYSASLRSGIHSQFLAMKPYMRGRHSLYEPDRGNVPIRVRARPSLELTQRPCRLVHYAGCQPPQTNTATRSHG